MAQRVRIVVQVVRPSPKRAHRRYELARIMGDLVIADHTASWTTYLGAKLPAETRGYVVID